MAKWDLFSRHCFANRGERKWNEFVVLKVTGDKDSDFLWDWKFSPFTPDELICLFRAVQRNSCLLVV